MKVYRRHSKKRKKEKKDKATQIKKDIRWEMVIEKLEERIAPAGPGFCVNDKT